MVLVILNVPADPSRTTANLRGPLVLNTERRLARQLVLQDDFWPLRYAVFGD
jgi:flagellar assembly factor FliW